MTYTEERKVSRTAKKIFATISDAWGLAEAQQRTILGLPVEQSLSKWHANPSPMGSEQMIQISHLMAIYKALHTLLHQASRANAWPQKPNKAPLFNGGSALDLLLRGRQEDIHLVRRYLKAEMGLRCPKLDARP
ncbi:DUF2384 domain-containing protein [Sphingomonas ginkgonis]|uniref:DUF2384 domain-containing protein n=1 Tax=Sphingomonas ginkgonis TaxID=2315330 RepID=A0A3R9WRS9_9SPHN|nr:DUF2384 domain-containing protein [Sphingomonas ginkgonis]RST30267.1 DUF2384 domain-containing protein [Sphingomonas ginkgonis]